MTNFGALFKNSNSETQIDGENRNGFLYLEGTASSTLMLINTLEGVISDPTATEPYLLYSNTPPIVTWQPDSTYYTSLSNLNEVTTSSYNDYFKDVVWWTEDGANFSIDFSVFIETPTKSDEDYGAQIWDGGKNICFDSGKGVLKIAEVHTISISPTTGSTTITHSSISNPYYVYVNDSIWSSGSDLYVEGIKKLSSTSVSVSWFKIFDSVGTNVQRNSTGTLLVCTY